MIYALKAISGFAAAVSAEGQRFGSQPPVLYENQIKRKEIKTKDGTEMKTMIKVEMTLSVIVFFFKAAQITKPMPSGIEKRMEMTFSRIETGKRSNSISMALRLTEM